MNKAHTQEYAIVDIETTGGHASASGITDIAIIIHDGEKIVDRYETLINPCMPIPSFIESLTGINNEMVAEAPTFADVAPTVFRYLEGRVFVAHNVNFDYSFIHYYLSQQGYKWNAPRLCTVRMSRRVKPGLPSYSLGKLCACLEIPIENRHRAGGDADATAILFGKLLQWDRAGIVTGMLRHGGRDQLLPPNLPKEEFEALPQTPGVYYFLDQQGKPVYIGKAINLKKRVGQHFTGNNNGQQRQNFLREICHVTFEPCGTEFMALLLEGAEIKHRWPKFNRSLKHYEARFGLFAYEDQSGYKRLAIGPLRRGQICLQPFGTVAEGRHLLYTLSREFSLCPQKCMLGPCPEQTRCYACGSIPEAPETYNERVEDALAHLADYLPSFFIFDKGRHAAEKSIVYIEKGQFYGMGYLDTETDLQSAEDLKSILSRYPSWPYLVQLAHTFAYAHPEKVKWIEHKDCACGSYE